MFFLQKEGVYSHGIFWVGESQRMGKEKAVKAALADRDEYHDWVLYEFVEPDFSVACEGDPDHREIFRTDMRRASGGG